MIVNCLANKTLETSIVKSNEGVNYLQLAMHDGVNVKIGYLNATQLAVLIRELQEKAKAL
jgi:hypothetical protein